MIINKDYIQALEEELRKIQVFRRELPLCFHLVTQAIETCKQQFSGPSECSDQTSTDVPVFEEFIPIKRSSDAEQNHSKTDTDNNSMKSDWLRSVQLWNQTPDLPSKEGSARKLRDEKRSTSPVSNGGGIKKEPRRKARRCWSPELHRRFLKALQHLGGSHVATPKQIREVMEVDGLTNDEVKSHLQKYRLYTRRPAPCIQNNRNVAIPAQFVVTGGMWVPPKSGTITSEGSNAPRLSKGINSAIAAWPQPYHQALGSERQHKSSQLGSGGDESHSSATSSS